MSFYNKFVLRIDKYPGQFIDNICLLFSYYLRPLYRKENLHPNLLKLKSFVKSVRLNHFQDFNVK